MGYAEMRGGGDNIRYAQASIPKAEFVAPLEVMSISQVVGEGSMDRLPGDDSLAP